MDEINKHPMDNFPVRPLRFGITELKPEDAAWSHTCPEFSVFINALALHVPHFERYLVKTMRTALPLIDDDGLRKDIRAIIGQEANHAHNFLKFNELLARRYPKVGDHDREAGEYFDKKIASDSLKQMVGYTAGYETFTFLAGIIILQNYDRWMADSNPTLKAIWLWHQVEEIEHGAVAFEVYQKLFGKHEWYRKAMVLKALTHIAMQTLKTYPHMARTEGWLRNPFKGAYKLYFCVKMLIHLAWTALPVFRRDYHPRKHPIATTKQNQIQIAWRRFEKSGGNVLEIDRAKMAKILDIPEPA